MKRSTFLRGAASLAAVALLATGCASSGSSSGGASLQQVRIGYIADYNGAALLAVAEQQDYWKKAGLDPKFSVFTNGPLQIQAMGTGDLDVGYIGSGAMWLPASGKAEIWAINSVSNADRIIAKAGINSLKDLRGKKVGVPAGTSGDLLLNMALAKEGMSKNDIEVVPMDPSTAVSAFGAGQIDGAALWYPLIDTLKKKVPDLKELVGNKDFMPDQTFPSAFVAQKGLAAKDPKLAAAVVSVIKQANDYRKTNQEETIAATAKYLKVDTSTLKGQADVATIFDSAELEKLTKNGTVDEWLNGLQEQFVTVGTVKTITDAKEFYASKNYLDAPKG